MSLDVSSRDVRGGAGGLAVSLAELAGGATRLHRVAGDLGDLALGMAGLRLHPGLTLACMLAPEAGLPVLAALDRLAGPAGASGSALALSGLARTVLAAADAYAQVEDLVARAVDTVELGVGLGIGLSAPVVGPVVAAGVAVAGPERVDAVLFDHPWIVPGVTDGLEGIVLGLGLSLPVVGAVGVARGVRAGAVPTTQEGALGVVLGATSGVVLDESGHRARVVAGAPRRGRAPRTTADLVAGDGPTSGGDRVRVTRVSRPDGSGAWIVDVPGTQTFDPRAGETIYDLTSNVHLAAGRSTLSTRAVAAALDDAQRRLGGRAAKGEPILFTGHSQGGMTAAALAADPEVRRRFPGVSHVVTSGAPIARAPVAADISVLAIEHRQDLVPGLDGADNPDRPSWVTVTRDVAEDLPQDAGATQAHDDDLYAETAGLVDDACPTDPSLVAWRQGASRFLDGEEAQTIDYEITRTSG